MEIYAIYVHVALSSLLLLLLPSYACARPAATWQLSRSFVSATLHFSGNCCRPCCCSCLLLLLLSICCWINTLSVRKFTRKSVRTEKQIEARQQRQQHKMLHIILAWKQTAIIIITICELHLRVQCTKCCNFRTATAAAMTNRVYSLPATLLLSHSLLLLFYYSCCKICTFLHQLQIYLPKNESTVRQSQSQRQSPTESGHLHCSDVNFHGAYA